MGFLDLDLPCDIRDIIADVRNLAKADDIKLDMIAMLALDLIGVIPVIGALKYSDEIGTLFKSADKVSVVTRSTDGAGVLAKHADEAGAWLHGVKVFRYSDETAEAVASGEKLLKESGTIYESFADMMSPEDAKRYLDFLENGSREGLTGAELAGVEKADALLVSRKVEYEDVWDLRNVGDALESGKTSNGLPDWLKARFEAGNSFNKENRPRYPYNEVEVYGDGKNYVVDSYIPGSEIVSRKFTQLASVKESTGIGYLNELQKKYPSGAIITDSPFNPKVLKGKTMTGNLNLEIPEQKGPIPQSVIDYANNKGIIIRDVNGKEYN